MNLILVAGAVGVVLIVALTVMLVLSHPHRMLPYEFLPNPHTELEQWTVQTPAGAVVVTAVHHPDVGRSYEIETCFDRRTPRLYYVAPTQNAARDKIRTLVEEYQAREVTR